MCGTLVYLEEGGSFWRQTMITGNHLLSPTIDVLWQITVWTRWGSRFHSCILLLQLFSVFVSWIYSRFGQIFQNRIFGICWAVFCMLGAILLTQAMTLFLWAFVLMLSFSSHMQMMSPFTRMFICSRRHFCQMFVVPEELPKNSFWDCWTVTGALPDMICSQHYHGHATEKGRNNGSEWSTNV